MRTPKDVVNAHKEVGARIVEVSLTDMSAALARACRRRRIRLMIYEKEPHLFPQVIGWQPDMVNVDHADRFLAALQVVESKRRPASTHNRPDAQTNQ